MIATIKTVLAAFFGVRGRKGAEAEKLKPRQLIVTAIVLALLLAAAVFTLVHFLVASRT